MWSNEDLEDAVRSEPAAAAAAMARLPWGDGETPLTPDAIAAAAATLNTDPAGLWIQQLDARRLLVPFAHALIREGVTLGSSRPLPTVQGWLDHLQPDEASRFMLRAEAFRCRVYVNGAYAGSGCLLGPGLVLTAWHVIAVAAPGLPQQPPPKISVQLSDGSDHDAFLPPQYESACTADEYVERVPKADADVADSHDVVLLTLKSQAARHLGYARLPSPVPPVEARGTVILAHFPNGEDPGLGFGRTAKIRNVQARLFTDVQTENGSSGGACFNNSTELMGVHQGVWGGRGVLIPLERFSDHLKDHVERDVSPQQLWRLDDSARFVVGRSLFVEAIHTSGHAQSRLRGVWVKRRDLHARGAGLGFTHEILQTLLLRRGPDNVLIRVSYDEIVADLFGDIRRRLLTAGLDVAAPTAAPGSEATQNAAEATARSVGSTFAAMINAAAQLADRTIWFFFDDASVALSEPNRLALEAFVAAVMNQPRLRIVVVGHETMTFGGLQFETPGVAAGDGAVGLLVEYIGTFTRSDIKDCLAQAQEEIAGIPDPAAVENATNFALAPVAAAGINSIYDMPKLRQVVPQMRVFVDILSAPGGVA